MWTSLYMCPTYVSDLYIHLPECLKRHPCFAFGSLHLIARALPLSEVCKNSRLHYVNALRSSLGTSVTIAHQYVYEILVVLCHIVGICNVIQYAYLNKEGHFERKHAKSKHATYPRASNLGLAARLNCWVLINAHTHCTLTRCSRVGVIRHWSQTDSILTYTAK